jgi:hypothetical protein
MLARANCGDVRGHNETTNKRGSSRRGTIVKMILSSVFLGTLLTISSAVIAAGTDTDPVIGTWKLNVAKSTFGAGPALKSQTRIYSQSEQGITLNMKTVRDDGKEITTQTTYHLDGKDYPVMGDPNYDSLSAEKIDTNTAKFTLKRAGKPVGMTRRTVSKDGKTLTATFKITDAKGVKSENVMVLDKQ